MKFGDVYKHFKGGEYFFIGVALPLGAKNLSVETVKSMTFVEDVRYHENTHGIKLYAIDGALFIDSDVPHVIYESDKTWAREIDDFFGHKNITGSHFQKKFTLMS